jgi:hypothetical protein
MQKRLVTLFASIAWLTTLLAFRPDFGAATLLAAPPQTNLAASGPAGAELRNDSISSQVALLGDSSYAVRERATRNLIEAGIAARPLLERLRSSPDPEIRMRAAKVLRIVVETDFRVRLRAFAADVDGRQAVSLPGWDRFRVEVGETREARTLFVNMQRSEATLLEALASGDPSTSALFAERCQDLQVSLLTQENPFGVVQTDGEDTNAGSIATLLFVGASPEVKIEEQQVVSIEGFLNYPTYRDALLPGQNAELYRRLLSGWLIKTGTLSPYVSLIRALDMDLKDASLNVGRRFLENGGGTVDARPFALLAVSRFGSQADLALVESYFSDEKVCKYPRQSGPVELQNQVRDVALAAAVHLVGLEVKDFGYFHPEANSHSLYLPRSLRFQNDAARKKAFQKWADWKASQAPQPQSAEK